ncbi:MAG: NADH-quinone oxidoreductase subunit N [Candidatus Kapaibacterium sp.]|nr:MAG: NADH-quinone oxidoreductase subunit N [Candidatus Kapabacteria bacterium]
MMNEWLSASPLLVVSLAAVVALIVDALNPQSERATYRFSLVALALALLAAIATVPLRGVAFGSMIRTGGAPAVLDCVFAIGGILTVLAARPYIAARNFEHDEFYTLVLYSTSGMMLIAHAQHLLVLFIGIEVMSLSFYVLAGYFRQTVSSIEGALKYFLLGAFATGFFVFGIALVYSATGSLDFGGIGKAITSHSLVVPGLLPIGIALIIVGLGFKVAVFPFHQWAPDVYDGAPTVVTGFMSTAGKAAALGAFIPLVLDIVPFKEQSIQTVLALSAAGTIIIGNVAAVVQRRIKRMLAYSSVAHAGYMLIGLAAANHRGLSAVIFYAVAYLFMQIGAFVVLAMLERDVERSVELDDCAGLATQHPALAAAMALFMFSLAGIPPMAGFFGKYYLFTAAIEAGYTWLAIIGVLGSMVSVYYYIGVVVYMYFKEATAAPPTVDPTSVKRFPLVVSAVAVIVLGVVPSMLESLLSSFWK